MQKITDKFKLNDDDNDDDDANNSKYIPVVKIYVRISLLQ